MPETGPVTSRSTWLHFIHHNAIKLEFNDRIAPYIFCNWNWIKRWLRIQKSIEADGGGQLVSSNHRRITVWWDKTWFELKFNGMNPNGPLLSLRTVESINEVSNDTQHFTQSRPLQLTYDWSNSTRKSEVARNHSSRDIQHIQHTQHLGSILPPSPSLTLLFLLFLLFLLLLLLLLRIYFESTPCSFSRQRPLLRVLLIMDVTFITSLHQIDDNPTFNTLDYSTSIKNRYRWLCPSLAGIPRQMEKIQNEPFNRSILQIPS